MLRDEFNLFVSRNVRSKLDLFDDLALIVLQNTFFVLHFLSTLLLLFLSGRDWLGFCDLGGVSVLDAVDDRGRD